MIISCMSKRPSSSCYRARLVVFGNGTLQISEIRRADEGTYLCQGTGPDGITQTFTVDLIIASK